MSGIYGLVRFDSAPVTAEDIAPMRRAMADWGPDGGGEWCGGSAGFGLALLHDTPEAVHERPTYSVPGTGETVVVEARIDNRNELFDLLGVPPDERGMPDGEVVARAYAKWGQDCRDRLLGDWSFAAWDEWAKTLFLARDHHGNTAVYYHHVPGRFFAFASSVLAVLAHPEVPRRIDELHLAQQLVLWQDGGPSTPYENVSQLAPAHTLRVTTSGTTAERYWWPEHVSTLRLRSTEDYLEAFRAHFDAAVRCRLRSLRPVGIAMSSGLDSGAVAALAAPALREDGRTLRAYTAVPRFDVGGHVRPGRSHDEGALAERSAEFIGNVAWHPVRSEGVTPIGGIRAALARGVVPDAPGNQFWVLSLYAAAGRDGVGTLLTGQYGNGTVSWHGAPDLMFRHFVKSLMRRRWRDAKPWLTQAVIPRKVVSLYAKFQVRRGNWYSWAAIRPEFAGRVGIAERMNAKGYDPTERLPRWRDRLGDRKECLKLGRNPGAASWAELSAPAGLVVRDPTVDKRLVEFCWSIPNDQFTDSAGHPRALLRKAFAGRLPEPVLWYKFRGSQQMDIVARLTSSDSEFDGLLRQIEASPIATDRLDTHRLRDYWNDLRSPHVDLSKVATLLRGLTVGLFLCSFE